MLEVYNKKHKKIGYIDGKKYLDKKERRIGFLNGNLVENKNGFPLLKLDNHNNISNCKNTPMGFILDSKIGNDDGPMCEISREKGVIIDPEGEVLLSLEGNFEALEIMDYFGIAAIYLKSIWSERVLGVKF
ncbi:MAG: hypothetical protein ACTSV5_02280 [Promethearchaeota archaeon]